MNHEKYKNVLQSHLLPFIHNFHGGFSSFVFQQDNSGAHKAKSVGAYMDATGISLIEWPAQSPDLNPIENAWASVEVRKWYPIIMRLPGYYLSEMKPMTVK